MTQYSKPMPAISSLNQPYWDALKQHQFVMPKCHACEKIWYPPTPFCPRCWLREFSWEKLSGRGTVNSWVVFHQAYFRSFKEDLPYNVAEVELEEGPRLLTNLVAVDNADIRIGMPVEIIFDDITDAVTLAKFKPVQGQLRTPIKSSG